MVKLLAIAEHIFDGADSNKISLRVHPTLVHKSDLSQVSGSFNAISFYGHALGHALFYGRGAGRMPTASAVVSDLIGVRMGTTPAKFQALNLFFDQYPRAAVQPFNELRSRYYLAPDREGPARRARPGHQRAWRSADFHRLVRSARGCGRGCIGAAGADDASGPGRRRAGGNCQDQQAAADHRASRMPPDHGSAAQVRHESAGARVKQRFHICIGRPPGFKFASVFEDLVRLMMVSLRNLGHEVSSGFEELHPHAHNIIFGYQYTRVPLAGTIIYQLETLARATPRYGPHQLDRLRIADEVWDYNELNLQFLRDNGLTRAKLLHIGYHDSLNTIPRAQ